MADSVTLSAAQAVVDAARAKADEIGVPMNIAVVDDGNNLTAFARMDGAWLGSIDIAQNKAYTARSFDMSTKDLAPLCQPNQPLFGIHASNQGRADHLRRRHPAHRRATTSSARSGSAAGVSRPDHEVAEAGVAAF